MPSVRASRWRPSRRYVLLAGAFTVGAVLSQAIQDVMEFVIGSVAGGCW